MPAPGLFTASRIVHKTKKMFPQNSMHPWRENYDSSFESCEASFTITALTLLKCCFYAASRKIYSL